MKKLQRRRVLSILLATVLVICGVFPVNAETVSETSLEPAKELTSEDMFLSEDVVSYIAEFFVDDIIDTGNTQWTSATEVVDVVPMYEETGSEVTSYTVNLTEGYVVISAYADVPNIIMEWSDEAEPLYTVLDSSENSKIIYTGVLEYFSQSENNTLLTLDGEVIPCTAVTDTVTARRSINNVPQKVYAAFLKEKTDYLNSIEGQIRPFANHRDEYITDPYEHAQNVYNAYDWVEYESADHWSSYANYADMDMFVATLNDCGPTAIVNIVKMYGNKYNRSNIKNESDYDVFDTALEVNTEHFNKTGTWYYDTASGGLGTDNDTANRFIMDVFDKYGVSVNVSTRILASYERIKNTLDSTNRLMYLMLEGHKVYSDHVVVGFAYLRLYSDDLYAYKSYLKVADGHNDDGARYIDIGDVLTDYFWRVDF